MDFQVEWIFHWIIISKSIFIDKISNYNKTCHYLCICSVFFCIGKYKTCFLPFIYRLQMVTYAVILLIQVACQIWRNDLLDNKFYATLHAHFFSLLSESVFYSYQSNSSLSSRLRMPEIFSRLLFKYATDFWRPSYFSMFLPFS